MRKHKITALLITLLLTLFTFIACEQPQTPKTATAIKTEYSQYVTFAGCFTYDEVNVVTVYNNGETEKTPLTAEMLSAEDQAKQNTVGEHTLTVNYNQMTCTFTLSVSEDVSKQITFTDMTTTYNGQVQSLAVQNLPQGASVVYTDNENKDAGVYEVKAVVTLPGGKELSYEAKLTIEKAGLLVQATEAKAYVGHTAVYGYELVGLMENEDERAFTALPTRVEGDAVSAIGTYENYVQYAGAEAKNYEITYVSADLLILALPQIVTENGKEYISLGSYPQSVVSDTSVIGALKEGIESGELVADKRGYYRLGDEAYARLTAENYVNGESYNQFVNGEEIVLGNEYFFLVEPIKWRVLENGQGGVSLMADGLIDVRPFWDIENAVEIDGKTYNPNDYARSEIRAWLNGAFMQIAFEQYEREIMSKAAVDNGKETALYTEYDYEDTQDYVYLPSYADITNAAYGFESNEDRMALTSDYVRALGTYMRPSLNGEKQQIGYGSYYLRSAGFSGIREVSVVDSFGDATKEAQSGSFIVCVRPMMNISIA